MYEFKPRSPQTIHELVRTIETNSNPENPPAFELQALTPTYDKTFLYKNPQWKSWVDFQKTTGVHEVFTNPDIMLSLKLNPESGLVIIDLDAPSGTPISPFETPLLSALPDILNIDSEGPLLKKPIVIQSPRGLHFIFKKPPN
jgi:hypothetical protein